MPRINIDLDDELHRRAKSKASLRGLKLYEYVRAAIREKVERDEAEDHEADRA